MFNKRWKKVLAWSLSVVIVIAVGGLFAANYAVDKLMTSMAEGMDLESENVPDSETVVEATPAVTAAPTETSVSDVSANEDSNNNDNTPAETVGPETKTQAEEVTSQPAAVENTSKDNGKKPGLATPNPTSSPAVEENKNLDGYSAQVSTDKAKHIQESVTVTEKANVASIVMGQLSMSDIKRLQELASGGLTIEEKREARSIILEKVSDEQYNELSQIAKKYGVSEGKTKDQIIAEEKALEEGSEQ